MRTATRRQFLRRAGCAGLGLLARPLRAAPPDDKRPLNFAFILIDDMGWSDLDCYGSTYHLSPRIDRLAREGMRFTDAYAACPVCSPTRASILTGKYLSLIHI